jgi:hypothetical protein
LLAALLRANGIPVGLCYQRLTITDQPPFCIHGLNAVCLQDHGGYHIDVRGIGELYMDFKYGMLLLFIALAAYGWCRILLDLIKAFRMLGWEQTTGKILLHSSTMHDGIEYVRNYLHYSYRVGDTEYFNNEIGHGLWGRLPRMLFWAAKIMLQGIHPEVKVRYCPDNPQQSIIFAGVPVRLFASLLGMSVVLFVFLSAFVDSVYFKRLFSGAGAW